MASDAVLQIEGLGLDKGRARLLDGITFALEKGCFHALLGPNGAGKSSLMRILYRAEKASHGAVRLDGRTQKEWPRRAYAARVGALVQEAVNLSGLTLRNVAALGLLPLSLPRAEAEARCLDALELVGLAGRAHEDAGYLSGGEQQRLFFAQLLALDPDIYLLDEPHNHLDLHYQYRLLEVVRARGRTVLASFHDLSLAARFCDAAFLLDHGRLVASGTPDDVLTRERLADVYRIDGDFVRGHVRIAGALAQQSEVSTLPHAD